MKIGIIGAGHAGVAAAEAAANAGAETVLFSNEEVLPYYRPRLPGVAAGQLTEEEVLMHPAEWYAGKRIALRRNCAAEAVDFAGRTVKSTAGEEQFDALIAAVGAGPFLPPFMNNAPECVMPLWTMADAHRMAQYVKPDAEIVIVGGGILGVEAALRFVHEGVKVTIVELADRLMPVQFGARAAHYLAELLQEKGIAMRLGVSVMEIGGDGRARVGLSDGGMLEADAALVSIGARRNVALFKDAGFEMGRGLLVDGQMRTSAAGVYACGDVIEMEGLNRCSALDAVKQGRVAGTNAVAALSGGELVSYEPGDAPVSFKHGDFELHSAGNALELDVSEHEMELDEGFGLLLMKDGWLAGVQMVGTGKGFRGYAQKLNQPLD